MYEELQTFFTPCINYALYSITTTVVLRRAIIQILFKVNSAPSVYARLYTSFSLVVNGQQRTIYGSIAYTSADNLGAQALGGFKESCSAHQPCRYCLGTLDEMKSKV